MRAAIAVTLLALSIGSAWAQNAPPAQQPFHTYIDGVELVAAGTDRVRFEVRARITSTRSVTVKKVRFDNMHLGKVPFYLSPLDARIEIKAGKAMPLPAIPMTVFFRDLDSLAPVAEAIRSGEIRVNGRAEVDLDLNLFERLAVRKWNPRVEVPVDSTIKVGLPAGELGKVALLAGLEAAQRAMGIAGSAINVMRGDQEKWSADLENRFSKSLLLLESRYSLRMADGQNMEVSTRGMAFQLATNLIVTTRELTEPWQYYPDTALLLEEKRATLQEASDDVLVCPVGWNMEDGASIRSGKLKQRSAVNQMERVYVPVGSGAAKVKVAARENGANYAELEVAAPIGAVTPIPAASSQPGQVWERVAVFRLTQEGTFETIFVPAHRDGDRIIFDTPVDDAAVGSPVMTTAGAIGIVQGEHSGRVVAN